MPVEIKIKGDRTPSDIVNEILSHDTKIKQTFQLLLNELAQRFHRVRTVLWDIEGNKIFEEYGDTILSHYLYNLACAFLIYGKEHFEQHDIEELYQNQDMVMEMIDKIDVKRVVDEYKMLLSNNDEEQLLAFTVAETTVFKISNDLEVLEPMKLLCAIISSACLLYATTNQDDIYIETTPSNESNGELTR